ncbi:MAG: hypothetical protein WDA75_16910 [Candidatus Latescibacterota bacterium]
MSLLRHVVRSVILGVVIGLGLVVALRFTSEGADLPLAIGLMVVVVGGLAVRRWLSFRRERRS